MTKSQEEPNTRRIVRILHVVHSLARGGLENGVVNLANGLPSDEFEQAICCLDTRGEMAERVSQLVQIYVMDRHGHSISLPFKLKRLIERFQPDIVHCRNWNAWPDTFLANILSSGDRKLVWSFHGFADVGSFPWRRRIASYCLAIGTDHLAAVCRHSAELFAARTGIASRRFEILSNGVDTRRFAPASDRLARKAELGLEGRNLLMLTVASLTPVKDHGSLLHAISRLEPINGLPIQFMFIGEGSVRAELQRAIKALGLSSAVILGGATDHVADYLAASDVFILPSKLEGMSNVILEAMASGLPVIAYAVGGNPELVVDGETGFLCAPGDIAGLSAAISRLAADANLRQRMGCAARRRAETLFSIDAMIAAYAGFYRRAAR